MPWRANTAMTCDIGKSRLSALISTIMARGFWPATRSSSGSATHRNSMPRPATLNAPMPAGHPQSHQQEQDGDVLRVLDRASGSG